MLVFQFFGHLREETVADLQTRLVNELQNHIS